MQSAAFKYVPKLVESAWTKGGKLVKEGYRNAEALASMSDGSRRAMEVLVNNLDGQIIEMSQQAFESCRNTIGRIEQDIYRQSAIQLTAEAEALGKNSMSLAKSLDGVTAFRDKTGRGWTLSNYGRMAVRTTAKQAETSAKLSLGSDLWYIVPHNSSCPVCAPLQGRVYSKSGMDKNYPPLTTAFGSIDGSDDISHSYLNIHPNCLCSLIPWSEDDWDDDEIEKMRRFSSLEENPLSRDPRTKAEIEAYHNKQRNRQRLLTDIKQWNKYRNVLGDDIPKTYRTWQKHKGANSEKYQEWKRKFREINAAAKRPENTKKLIAFSKGDDIYEAIRFAENGLNIKASANYSAMNVDVANMVNESIANAFNIFDGLEAKGYISGIYIVTDDDNFVGAYNTLTKQIKFKKDYVTPSGSIERIAKIAIRQNRQGFWSTDSPAHCVRHEIGHALENMIRTEYPERIAEIEEIRVSLAEKCGIIDYSSSRKDRHLVKKAGQYISYYGLADESELIAESVAEYLNGNPRKVAMDVMSILLRRN